MNHDGVVGVLHFPEYLDQGFDIVAVSHILIVQPHGTEEVALRLAVGLAEQGEILVEAAMVLGDAHPVVVHDDDDAGAQFASLVETFEGLASAQRAVAYHHHDVLMRTLDVAGFLQTGGKGDGSGGVTQLKLVVLRRFRRTAISRNLQEATVVIKAEGTAGEHLVGITLVGYVEDELVFGAVEHIVHGNGCLHDTEIGPHMATDVAVAVQDAVADFPGERVELPDGELPHVLGRMNLF